MPLSKRPVRVHGSATSSASTTIQDNPEEIVVRDENGRYQFEVPGIPLAQRTLTQKESKYHLLGYISHVTQLPHCIVVVGS